MAGYLRRENGFSLIELLVVIAIIAIGSAFSVPMLKDFSARYRLRGAARDVASVLQLVRLEAVKRKVNCTVVFSQSVNGETFDYVAFVDSDEDWVYDSGETVLSSVNFPDTVSVGAGGVTFIDNAQSRPAVAFNPKGFPRGDGGVGSGTVNLKNNIGGGKKVIVASSGRIRIE